MRPSDYLQMIEKNGYALCWHSLYGNLFFLEPKYVNTLHCLSSGNKSSNEKIIEDLKNAKFLTDGTDERKYLEEKNRGWAEKLAEGGQLRLLNLMISEECNFGCRHCLHRCSLDANPTHGKKSFMDWEVAKTAIDSYAKIVKKWGHGLNVHFGSAEPLLNYSVLTRAICYIKSLDPNAAIAVNTNLSLLQKEMADFFRDNRVFISTSLDGPKEGNDAIRQLKNGGGTFEIILNKIEMLQKSGYPLDGFSVTINDLNFDQIDHSFIYWAKRQGFSGIATDIDLINTVNSKRSIDDCVEKLMEIRLVCSKVGIENFGTWTTAYDNLVNEPEDDMPTFCKAVKGRNISVNPEGLLFICGHTTTPCGHITEIDKVFEKDSPYISLIESRLPGADTKCRGCEIEGVCAGQCQITREVSQNTGNNRDSYLCQFYRKATKRLLTNKLLVEINQ